jgi:DNA-3-methyladenine glycosylase
MGLQRSEARSEVRLQEEKQLSVASSQVSVCPEKLLGRISALKTEFFDRDPRVVARELLGKLLIRKTAGGVLAGRIVETEAYLGEGDLAAHAAAGKTERNSVLFGPPGIAYVYFIYGNHYCLNVSCLPDGVAGGVLFRAMEPVAGIEEMAAARGMRLVNSSRFKEKRPSGAKARLYTARSGTAEAVPFPKPTLETGESCPFSVGDLKKISSGPGRMCEALGVTRVRDNGKSLVSAKSDLRLADDGFRVGRVVVTARIGITKSAEHRLRYLVGGNRFVSGPTGLSS